MSYEPQTFSAPDGTEMVILPASEYARLKSLDEDAEDVAEAQKILARIEAGEGTMPGEVLDMILDEHMHPVAAWRRYRGLSQAALADKAGLSQVWVSRIERRGGYGSRASRQRLAEALEAPLWALEEEPEPQKAAVPTSNKGRKYQPLRQHLEASGKAVVILNFAKVDALVGGLPPSATEHREWWANHAGNSQAKGWMDAGYMAEPDAARRLVTFRRRD
ncbi:MAG: helix-turn-helix domain-containing protein [Allosphingosinicella sp.]